LRPPDDRVFGDFTSNFEDWQRGKGGDQLYGIIIILILHFGQPTYEKVNEELFLDKPLHVILNKSKLAYRIYVILITNKEFFKKNLTLCTFLFGLCYRFCVEPMCEYTQQKQIPWL
jgi:hypothetical protein